MPPKIAVNDSSPATVPETWVLSATPPPEAENWRSPTCEEDQENRRLATATSPDAPTRAVNVPEDPVGGELLLYTPVTTSSCWVKVQIDWYGPTGFDATSFPTGSSHGVNVRV